jgi:hypothetical protein
MILSPSAPFLQVRFNHYSAHNDHHHERVKPFHHSPSSLSSSVSSLGSRSRRPYSPNECQHQRLLGYARLFHLFVNIGFLFSELYLCSIKLAPQLQNTDALEMFSV